MKFKQSTMPVMILLLLNGCASKASGIDQTSSWCLNDKHLCASHADTVGTQTQIIDHNVGYDTACPKQPHVCK